MSRRSSRLPTGPHFALAWLTPASRCTRYLREPYAFLKFSDQRGTWTGTLSALAHLRFEADLASLARLPAAWCLRGAPRSHRPYATAPRAARRTGRCRRRLGPRRRVGSAHPRRRRPAAQVLPRSVAARARRLPIAAATSAALVCQKRVAAAAAAAAESRSGPPVKSRHGKTEAEGGRKRKGGARRGARRGEPAPPRNAENPEPPARIRPARIPGRAAVPRRLQAPGAMATRTGSRNPRQLLMYGPKRL